MFLARPHDDVSRSAIYSREWTLVQGYNTSIDKDQAFVWFH